MIKAKRSLYKENADSFFVKIFYGAAPQIKFEN